MKHPENEHLFPILDQMMSKAVEAVEAEGSCLSCKKGCAHCCYLFVEITWEEAMELAKWVLDQKENEKQTFINKISENAARVREILAEYKKPHLLAPLTGEQSYPEDAFDEYFHNNTYACPFLKNNQCGAYAHRPTPCRLHVVTSDVNYCKPDKEFRDEGVLTPTEVDDVHEAIGPVMGELHTDPRWGQLGIMVEAALKELQDFKAHSSTPE